MILYICYSLCLYIYSANIIYCKYATHARLLFIDRARRKTCQDALLQAYLLGWEIACRSTSLLSLFTLLFSTFLLIFVFFLFPCHLRARACDVFDSAKRFDIDVETSVGCRKKKKRKINSLFFSALTHDSDSVFQTSSPTWIFVFADISRGKLAWKRRRTKFLRNTWNLIPYY